MRLVWIDDLLDFQHLIFSWKATLRLPPTIIWTFFWRIRESYDFLTTGAIINIFFKVTLDSVFKSCLMIRNGEWYILHTQREKVNDSAVVGASWWWQVVVGILQWSEEERD